MCVIQKILNFVALVGLSYIANWTEKILQGDVFDYYLNVFTGCWFIYLFCFSSLNFGILHILKTFFPKSQFILKDILDFKRSDMASQGLPVTLCSVWESSSHVSVSGLSPPEANLTWNKAGHLLSQVWVPSRPYLASANPQQYWGLNLCLQLYVFFIWS